MWRTERPRYRLAHADRAELRIATDVAYYDFCSGTVRDEFGDVFRELTTTLAEDAE